MVREQVRVSSAPTDALSLLMRARSCAAWRLRRGGVGVEPAQVAGAVPTVFIARHSSRKRTERGTSQPGAREHGPTGVRGLAEQVGATDPDVLARALTLLLNSGLDSGSLDAQPDVPAVAQWFCGL